MNLNFDLDIKNYTIRELEDLFELPNNYDETIIEIQETKLRHNIISDRSIMALTKTNTLDIINKVNVVVYSDYKYLDVLNTINNNIDYRYVADENFLSIFDEKKNFNISR